MSRRIRFALNLANDAAKITEYEQFHRRGGVWPYLGMDAINDLRVGQGKIWGIATQIVSACR
jgi:hypothetical protein